MSFGLGCQATINASPAPPLSFWTLGGYWDLSTVGGFNGDPIPGTPIPSSIGANSLAVIDSPHIQDSAIGGTRAMLCDTTSLAHFELNACASRIAAGLPWTMAIEYCATSDVLPVPLMCAGSSGDAVHNWFRAQQINGTQFLTLTQNTVANGLTTTNNATDLQYNPHQMVIRSDGTTITGQIDNGSPFSLGPIDTAGFTCDRLAFGAIVSTAIAQGGDVLFSKIAFSFSRISDAQMAGQIAAWQALHLTVPIGSAPYYAMSGNSETQGTTGNNAGGWRQVIGTWIEACGMSVYAWGPFEQGTFQYRQHVAQGGADCALIASNYVSAINTIPGATPKLTINMMGTNNMGAGSFPSANAAYTAAATSMANALIAKDPTAKITLTKLLAFDPAATPFAANATTFNASLVSTIWPALKAAFPGTFIVPGDTNAWDSRTSIPNYSAPLYFDTTHLNTPGYDLEGADQIMTVGHLLRALSPTINALAVLVSSPAPAATIHVGTPTTIKFGATRYPCLYEVFLNGVVVGTGTATPKTVLGSFVFTAVGGQIGAGVITVRATDLLDGTVAVSPGVNVTIAP